MKQKHYILGVDASLSQKAIGGYLYQGTENNEIPLRHFSKKLTESEQRRKVYELELLGLQAGTGHFEEILSGRINFSIDRRALLALQPSKSFVKGIRLNRALEYLSNFDFNINYVKGSLNTISDIFFLVINLLKMNKIFRRY